MNLNTYTLFCWRTDCARSIAAQGFALKNDDTEDTTLLEIRFTFNGTAASVTIPTGSNSSA